MSKEKRYHIHLTRSPEKKGEIEVLYGDRTDCMRSDNPLSVLHGIKVDNNILEDCKNMLRKNSKIDYLEAQVKA